MSISHIPRMCFTLVGVLCLASALNSASADTGASSEGTAYRVDTGAPVYRESHMLYQSGGKPARLVLYRCMDGSAFARKTVVERSSAATPDFDFHDGRTGYREGVRTKASGREVFWQKSGSELEKSKMLVVPANAVIDAGFDATIRSQWQRLAPDASINTNFLLPSAMRFLKVNIHQVTDAPVPGVIQLRMKLDTWYGFAAPDTFLHYRISDQRLLRFKGIGPIRDARGRNQAVRIEFPGGLQGRRASTNEITAAGRLPLSGRCGG